MTLIKNPTAIIIIAFFFIITTCTTDDSITGNSNQFLGKTTSAIDITTGDKEDPTQLYINRLIGWIMVQFAHGDAMQCAHESADEVLGAQIIDTSKSYDFRDNYLSKSEKGEVYTACYYLLSTYGIKNNLVNKYYKEHFELLKTGTSIAYNLQYGSNNDKILLNKATSDALKDMLKVYRNSPNYKDIEPVLEYLEMDLEKYYNKPKYEIAVDFDGN